MATNANDNSSEFSQCVQVAGCPDAGVENDHDVDVTDIRLAGRWNAPALFDPAYDLNCDDVIDIADVGTVTAAFGT